MNYWPTNMAIDPIGDWPGVLTARRQASPFKATLGDTMDILRRELRELDAKNARLQVAVPASKFRLDGKPYADAKPSHPGLILTLDSKHGPLSYPCDTFTTWQGNLRAVALALEALRKVDRYGVTRHGEQYRGFLALEAMPMPYDPFTNIDGAMLWMRREFTDSLPYEIDSLGIRERLRVLLRIGKRESHPDRGGNAETFRLVMKAEELARNEGML